MNITAADVEILTDSFFGGHGMMVDNTSTLGILGSWSVEYEAKFQSRLESNGTVKIRNGGKLSLSPGVDSSSDQVQSVSDSDSPEPVPDDSISEIEKLPHLIDGGGLEIDEKSVLELKAGALQLNGRLVSNGDVVIGDEAEVYISKELHHLQRTTTDSDSDSVTAKIVLDVYPEK